VLAAGTRESLIVGTRLVNRRVASLAKRWLLGTHQGSVEDTHLQSY
jgi:hypothetical protein